MPLVHRLGEHVLQGPAPTTHRVGGNADLSRDLIRSKEANAANVASEPVRILCEHLDRVGAIRAMDTNRAARAHTVRVQEDHDLPHGTLALPVLDDAAGAHAADAGDVEQAIGLAVDHVEHAGAEGRDELPGQMRADALDQAGAEIALDTFGRIGGRDTDPVGLELLPVRAVVDPGTGGVDVLADGDLRRVADDRRRLTSSPQGHAQDAEPALRVVIGDALHLPGHVLRAPLVAGQRERTASPLVGVAGTHAWATSHGSPPLTTMAGLGEPALPLGKAALPSGSQDGLHVIAALSPGRRWCRCARPASKAVSVSTLSRLSSSVTSGSRPARAASRTSSTSP